jgi:membrane protein DedA with SNARE-associated domain
MPSLGLSSLAELIAAYGYFAVFIIVMLESSGIPLPGETALVTAAIYAGTGHQLNIFLVIAAAALAAVIGDNIGYWAGRRWGFGLLQRHFDEANLKLGQYIYYRYGGVIIFFGRFVAVLRAFAAILAGANHYAWSRFLLFNAAGGLAWACLFGFSAFLLGEEVHQLSGLFATAMLALAALCLVLASLLLRRQRERLLAEAELAFPGPLRDPAAVSRR